MYTAVDSDDGKPISTWLCSQMGDMERGPLFIQWGSADSSQINKGPLICLRGFRCTLHMYSSAHDDCTSTADAMSLFLKSFFYRSVPCSGSGMGR